MTPEHIHLILNHIPIIGLACALVPLLTGILARSKSTLVAGCVLAAVCGWTTPFVMETGEEAYGRYHNGSVAALLDGQANRFLHEHEERAERGSIVLYTAAVLATLSLVLAVWKPAHLRPAAILVALACIASFGAGIWIADSGGKIRRVDFRESAGAAPLNASTPSRQQDED